MIREMDKAPAKAETAVGVMEEVGSNFDTRTAAALCYGNMHEDLKQTLCDKGMCHTEAHVEALVDHWKMRGSTEKENRIFCTPEITKQFKAEMGVGETAVAVPPPDTAVAVATNKEMYRIGYNPKTIRGMQI